MRSWTCLAALLLAGAAHGQFDLDLDAGSQLRVRGYPLAAAQRFAQAARQSADPAQRARAVEALLGLRVALGDDTYVLDLLEPVPLDSVPVHPQAAPVMAYLQGLLAQRQGRLEAAERWLERVSPEATVYARARYLLGVLQADPRLPSGAHDDQALQRFGEILQLRDWKQEELAEIQQLARLGMGRIRYGRGEYAQASQAYEAVPRFSRFWGEALLENAFSRFRRGDLGGALGSLESLHAPQFEGAFQPESWILKASVFYFACLKGEAHAAIQAFEQLYGPIRRQLEDRLAHQETVERYVEWIDADDPGFARGLRAWVRHQEPVADALRLRRMARAEASGASKDRELGPLAGVAVQLAGEAERSLTALAGRRIRERLEEAREQLKRLADQADVVRVETAKVDKELVQAGVDQPALLARQRLHRPPVPARGWEYWQFDGEYWLDEMGYYQYTLKNGCPPRAEEKSAARP